jgi:NADH-quinone oxidoreductase subunit E
VPQRRSDACTVGQDARAHRPLAEVGRNNVAFCTNISCWLNGAEDLVAHAEKKLGCKLGESTADGRVYLKREEECVAACCGAPVMLINGHYHEKLDAAKVDALLDGLK